MRKLVETVKNIWKIEDLRQRILITLLFIAIYRFGSFVVLPGIDANQLEALRQQTSEGLMALLNAFSGGAFSRFSLFAMSINPYITASIVIQLLAMVIPSLERLAKEGGETGKEKMNTYTKILTIVLAIVEGLGIYLSYRNSGIFVDKSFLTGFLVVLSLVAGILALTPGIPVLRNPFINIKYWVNCQILLY